MNLSRLSARIPGASVVRCNSIGRSRAHRRRDASQHDLDWLPFPKWYHTEVGEDGAQVKVVTPPTYSDAFPKHVLIYLLDKIIGGAKIKSLSKYIGMSFEELKQYYEAYLKVVISNPNRVIKVDEALKPFKDRIIAWYEEESSTPINWWIIVDPERQYTASLNPRMENPTEWYGPDVVNPTPSAVVDPNVFLQSLIGAIESNHIDANPNTNKVYGNQCGLCMGPVLVGSANSITLPCGHTFHWSAASVCLGLYRWTLNNTDCPYCRKKFNAEENPEPVLSPIVLAVQWD